VCQSWLVFELFVSCISLVLFCLSLHWSYPGVLFSHPPLCIQGLWSIYVSSLLGALLSQPHWHQWKIIQMRSFTPLLIKREKNNSWAIILQTWCVYHEYVHVYIVTSGPDHLQEIWNGRAQIWAPVDSKTAHSSRSTHKQLNSWWQALTPPPPSCHGHCAAAGYSEGLLPATWDVVDAGEPSPPPSRWPPRLPGASSLRQSGICSRVGIAIPTPTPKCSFFHSNIPLTRHIRFVLSQVYYSTLIKFIENITTLFILSKHGLF